MGFFATFLWSLALMVVGELLRPKQKPEDATAASIDDFSFPTVSEERNIPWFAGTVKIEGPNLHWYGDLVIDPIKKKIRTGLFSSETVIIGYKYSLGMEMFLGVGPIDDVSEVRFGTEAPSSSKSVSADEIIFDYDDEDFFGGDEKDGGIKGRLRIMRGTTTQTANEYIQEVLERERSAYRGLICAVFEAFYIGTRENPKPITFIAHRYPNSLGVPDGKHIINGGDANPACMIYELLTNQKWGPSVPSSEVDVDGFRAVAQVLHAEGYGMSMLINRAQTARSIISEILRHIDGVMFTDNQTGLITLALARDDYDVETLPRFGASQIQSFKWSRQSWSETKNHIIINYIDREADFKERPLPIRDTANIQSRGGVVDVENIGFLGFSNGTTALKRGSIAAKTLGYPLMNVNMVLDGRAWELRPGSVIRADWPADGIDGVVLRVTRVAYEGARRNRIDVDCVEDVFAVGEIAYIVPPPTNWNNPVTLPVPLAAEYIFEAPYHATGDEGMFVITVGTRADSTAFAYQTWHDPAGGTAYVQTGQVNVFTSHGTLLTGYPANTPADDPDGFTIQKHPYGAVFAPTGDGRQRGESLALIQSAAGEEIIAWGAFDGTTVSNVLRGVLDTLPLSHPAGATMWFLSSGVGLLSDTAYASAGTVTAKLPTLGPRGPLALVDVDQLSVDLQERAKKPYPPAKLRVDGAVGGVITGDAEITWSIRHRVLQHEDGVVVSQDADSYTDTPEGGFEVRLYIDNVLIRTVVIDAPPFDSYTYTAATRAADNADLTLPTRAEVRAVNGAYASVWRSTANFYFDGSALEAVTLDSVSPMPWGAPGQPYSYTFAASGGVPPYTWSIVGGTSLPDVSVWIMDPLTGEVSLTPTVESVYSITVQVEDSIGSTDSGVFEFIVQVPCTDYLLPEPVGENFVLPYQALPIEAEGNTLHVCRPIIVPAALSIAVSPPPQALAGAYYEHTYTVSGGVTPYDITITAIPMGLTAAVSEETKVLMYGQAPSAGNYGIAFSVDDSDVSSGSIDDDVLVLTATAEEAAVLSSFGSVGGFHAIYDFTRAFLLRADAARLLPIAGVGGAIERVCNICPGVYPSGLRPSRMDLTRDIGGPGITFEQDGSEFFGEGATPLGSFTVLSTESMNAQAVSYLSKQAIGFAIDADAAGAEMQLIGDVFCPSQGLRHIYFAVYVLGGNVYAEVTYYNGATLLATWTTDSYALAGPGKVVGLVEFDFNSTTDSIVNFEVNGVTVPGRSGDASVGWLTNNGAATEIRVEAGVRKVYALARVVTSLSDSSDIAALRNYLNAKAGL